MKYGFVIDNRKCIGCHACTTACKSEHDVPVGVNRTWVKQVEKGKFPNTRRLFSVMRCNHCTDAPCVTICPTEALYTRKDGIVDFDKDRCIGCKSCMQACPYDALYIDPDTNTAAKCNYCAHRIDIGLEPACVNVCPEEAIISGDMEDPDSKISNLLSRQTVKVRKPEKGTIPNLYYIEADDVSLIPSATTASSQNIWGSQAFGVGHFAKEAEKMAFSNSDLIDELMQIDQPKPTENAPKSVELLMNDNKQVYNTPHKGILWGWEVSAYVWTKAISAGIILIALFVQSLKGFQEIEGIYVSSLWISLFFLGLTGVFLIKDLDQPKRFLYVLLRPNWSSWLVRGAYAISAFGAMLSLALVSYYMNWMNVISFLKIPLILAAFLVAVYTAFLFSQAKGRDFWQSPMLALHMLNQSLLAGIASMLLVSYFLQVFPSVFAILYWPLMVCITINFLIFWVEISTTHPTNDAKLVIDMITKGEFKWQFWIGVIILSNLMPLLLMFVDFQEGQALVAPILILGGIYLVEKMWVEIPQRIPLS